MKTICLHHNDIDGRGAATVIYNSTANVDKFYEINYDYDSKEIMLMLDDYDKIIIIDFSLTEKEMDKLIKENKQLIWIDHHESQKDNKYWDDITIKGIRDTTKSGVLLTWEYCNPQTQKIPTLVSYINDYDLWKFEYGEIALRLNESIKNLNFNDNQTKWSNLLFNPGLVKQKIMQGRNFYERRLEEAKKVVKNGFECNLAGYKCYAVNSTDEINLVGEEILKTYNLAAIFKIVKDKILVSLRGKDVYLIAKKFNGGGHKNAAGFSISLSKGLKSVFKNCC